MTAGLGTALLATQTELTEEEYQSHLPFVIREVAEMGGHGFHGANAAGDVELSASYMRARQEGYAERVEPRGFLGRLAHFMQSAPCMELTAKGWRAYGEFKAQEREGTLEPNEYAWFFSG